MGCSEQPKTAFPDEQTLRAWEDMRIDLLHELQDGASAPDDLIDLMGQLVVILKPSEATEQAVPALRRAA